MTDDQKTGEPYFAPSGSVSHQERLQREGADVDPYEQAAAVREAAGLGMFDKPEPDVAIEEQLLVALERSERNWSRQRIMNVVVIAALAVSVLFDVVALLMMG